MRVIGTIILDKFSRKHAQSKTPLSAWLAEAQANTWQTTQDVKKRYPSASILSKNRIVFNIGGNKFRLVVVIRYQNGVVQVLRIGTHAEYDKWKLD